MPVITISILVKHVCLMDHKMCPENAEINFILNSLNVIRYISQLCILNPNHHVISMFYCTIITMSILPYKNIHYFQSMLL